MSKIPTTKQLRKWQYYATHSKKKRIRSKNKSRLNKSPRKLFDIIPFKKLEKPTGPNVEGMTRIDKFQMRMADGTVVTHPAFIRDGKEVDCIYIGAPSRPRKGTNYLMT